MLPMAEKILIVDDQPETLRLIGLNLERGGYAISVAQTAEQALAKVQADRPNLIILDVMLPDVSGLELCQRLREREDTAAIPIIMLSAKGDVADKIAGLKSGADEYVTKPIDLAELLARVASLLERTRRLQAGQPGKAGKVITFLGAKGGVGTTTTLLNVGITIAAQGPRVVAAELRPYRGSFPLMLGLQNPPSFGDLLAKAPAEITPRTLSDRLIQHVSGLKVLCAPDALDPRLDLKEAQAQAIVQGLAGAADYLLVDVAPAPTSGNQVTFSLSRTIIMVLEPVRDCLEAGAAMAAWVKGQVGAGCELRLAVVNRASMASPVSMREVQDRIGWPIAGVIPLGADECARAQLLGMPVLQSQPEVFVARALKELGAKLV
jgi:CheY-like chemotaxis protein/MinD-like ATPase involved in chromosome partitioning or flagellar assembly